MGQALGECALFNHKCDKVWQAGSLYTQVGAALFAHDVSSYFGDYQAGLVGHL